MTTGGTCRVPDCGAIIADAFVCATCAHRLLLALDDVPGLLSELDTDLARLSRRGGREGGRDADPPLPYDQGASITRDALVSTLRTWALVLDGDVLAVPPAATGTGLAAWLAERAEGARHHPDGGALADEVCAAVEAARDHVHGRRGGPSILLGLCPDCRTAVYGPQSARGARCRRDGCDGWVDAAEWRQEAFQALRSAVLPAVDAARAASLVLGTEVTADRIRQWRARGRLDPADHGPDSRPRYRVADICVLVT